MVIKSCILTLAVMQYQDSLARESLPDLRGASQAKNQRVLIRADAGSGMWINLTDQRTDTLVVPEIRRNLALNSDSTVRKRTRGD